MNDIQITEQTQAIASPIAQEMAYKKEMLELERLEFQLMHDQGKLMATCKGTPAHLRNNVGDCCAVISQARRWNMDKFAVASKTFVINGLVGYESQLVNAVINANAPIKHRLQYEWFGNWDKIVGKFATKTNGAGKPYQAPAWTPADEKGCGVKVWTTLRGEDEPRCLELLMAQATVRNSTLWASDPKQQLAYLAVKRWARLYCPDVILGVYTPDELQENEYIDNGTGRKTKNVTELLKEKIAAKKKEKVKIEETEIIDSKIIITDKNILEKFRTLDIPDYITTDYFKNDAAGSLKINESFDELTDDQRAMIVDNADKAAKKISEWVDTQN